MPRTERPTRVGMWGRRQWLHLLASVVGFGMVVGSTAEVFHQNKRLGDRHGLGGAIVTRLKRQYPYKDPYMISENWWTLERVIMPEGDRFVDIGASWDEGVDAICEPAEMTDSGFWRVRVVVKTKNVGVWARTRRDHTASVLVTRFRSGSIRQAHVQTELFQESVPVRAVAVESALNPAVQAIPKRKVCPIPESMELLTSQDEWKGQSTKWSGYAINTATLLGLGMWVWFTPVVIHDVRRWRRARRGACVKCSYDLRGLPGGAAVCPECGSAIPVPIPTDG